MIENNIEKKDQELIEKIKFLNLELEKIENESKNNWDLYLRCRAEIENIKKRTDKEILNVSTFALQNILTDILPLIDSFELCIKNFKKEENIDGIFLIYKMLLTILEKYNLKKIDVKENDKFDSSKHEVVSVIYEENIKDDDSIKDIMQNGYVLNDRVIRYTKVSIIKNKN